jgi:hypothetical protein
VKSNFMNIWWMLVLIKNRNSMFNRKFGNMKYLQFLSENDEKWWIKI